MLTFNRVRNVGSVLLLIVGLVGAGTLAQNAPPAPVRADISGDWQVVTHEDTPNYGPGPELGDYAGLPINAADRQKAETWDATILSQPERQTQTHPVQYVGNNRGPQRILKVLDPVTQQQVAYLMAGNFGRADRTIWLDGRPHPSDYSEHTWDGFSTGVWQNGALVITTTHMKQGVIRRNGAAVSPYEKMVEHFMRHGEYMTVFIWIDDPTYLDEPMTRSYTEVWNPNGFMAAGQTFQAVDELGDKPLGWVPFYPLGTKHREFAENVGLPFEATQGGAEQLYPEYQLTLQQLMQREAAKNALARKNATLTRGSDSLMGEWVLDRPRSTYSGNAPAKRRMTFEKASDGTVTHITDTTSDAAFPDIYQVRYAAKLDGKDYPVVGVAFDAYSLKRIDGRTVERTAKLKGAVLETSTYVVSSDNMLLTVTTKGKDTDGVEYSRTEIFNRQ